MACGGWEDAAGNGSGAYVSPRETVGTSGSIDNEITIRGCVVRLPPDEYVLTSSDDPLASQYRATAGRHQGDADARPTDVRGNEILRPEQNPSLEFGRFRLTGSSEQFVTHVDREVEVKGLIDERSETPNTLRVVSMRTTGRQCSSE
jgi:hypothetical protein